MRGPLPTGASCRSGHEKVSGPVIGKGLEGIGGLRRGVLGMGMINVDATAIGGQHIHQGRLGRIRQHTGAGHGPGQPSGAGIVDGVLPTVIPMDM